MFGETGNYTNPVKLCGLMSFYGDQIIRFINISFATCISRCYANVSLKLWQSINYVILLYWILSVRPCARPDVSEACAWAINIRISGTSSRRTRERQCIRNIYIARVEQKCDLEKAIIIRFPNVERIAKILQHLAESDEVVFEPDDRSFSTLDGYKTSCAAHI